VRLVPKGLSEKAENLLRQVVILGEASPLCGPRRSETLSSFSKSEVPSPILQRNILLVIPPTSGAIYHIM
jgi:hypothetical protein